MVSFGSGGEGATFQPDTTAGGTPAVVLGTAPVSGTQTTFLRDDDTIEAFDTTVPITQAYGDVAAVGVVARAARRDHRHGMPAAAAGGTPAVVLGTVAAAGVQTTFLRDDDTIVAFDATAPVTQASADAAATGSAAVAARRDHRHGMPTIPAASVVTLLKANSGTSTTTAAHNLDTVAISGLAAGDMLLVIGTVDQAAQTSAGQFAIYNNTDAVNITGDFLPTVGAGGIGRAFLYIMQSQQATTTITSIGARQTGGIVMGDGSAFTTAWTGSWTLAFRSAGQTAGGTHRWRWSVYRLIAA